MGDYFTSLFLLVLLIVVSIYVNMDIPIYPQEVDKATAVCAGNGGLIVLGKDNGGEYTAYCKNGQRYTYKLPEKD